MEAFASLYPSLDEIVASKRSKGVEVISDKALSEIPRGVSYGTKPKRLSDFLSLARTSGANSRLDETMLEVTWISRDYSKGAGCRW